MEMTSSRLMALIAILAALTSIEVEACTGEPCNIGNPNSVMCRLVRETDRTGSVITHRSLLGEPMSVAHRRLAATSSRRRLQYKGKYGKSYPTQAKANASWNTTSKTSGSGKKKPLSGSSKKNGTYVTNHKRGGSDGWKSDNGYASADGWGTDNGK